MKYEWSSEDKGDRIKIEGPARLSYASNYFLDNLIRTSKPIPQRNWKSFYFEAKIVNGGSNDFIGIGITEKDPNTRTKCFPGWDTNRDRTHKYSTLGIGYHGDDGGVFHNKSSEAMDYFETFTTGDVVGCLVQHSVTEDHENITVQFTKNGRKSSLPPVQMKNAVWYPTIAMASDGAVVDINFGEHPFLYTGVGNNFKQFLTF